MRHITALTLTLALALLVPSDCKKERSPSRDNTVCLQLSKGPGNAQASEADCRRS